jgi:hypothetical protein
VTLYVVITVGWLFLMMMVLNGPRSSEGPMMASPFFGPGEIAFELYNSRGIDDNHLGWLLFWTIVYALLAAGLLFATLGTFNACLGRVEAGLPALGPRLPRRKKEPAWGLDTL